jgi:hypothetical protein
MKAVVAKANTRLEISNEIIQLCEIFAPYLAVDDSDHITSAFVPFQITFPKHKK